MRHQADDGRAGLRGRAWTYCLLALLLAGGASAEDFALGIDVFLQHYVGLVAGQRVGLLTNQTGRNGRGVPTVDLLAAHPQVKLVALFAAEHGIRGQVAAGKAVEDAVDPTTGLRVFSLYGRKGHRPTPEMLATVDTVIYDIQDVGSRAYTYVWTMAEMMAACGAAGKRFIVLDRPNPLTCARIDGPVTEERWRSFIGLYPVPRVYGLTCGELAAFLNGEYALKCQLTVIPLANYRRGNTWTDTGAAWVASSPNIPSPDSAMCFAATGTLGELGLFHIGIGTAQPFQVVGVSWLDPRATAAALGAYRLPGVEFLAAVIPVPAGSRATATPAILLRVTDPATFLPATTEIAMLHCLSQQYPRHFRWDPARFEIFDKAMGSSAPREALMRGANFKNILDAWAPAQEDYLRRRAKYLIYPE